MISKYSRKNDLISHILHQKDDILNQTISVSGWVRTCRTSEKGFGFCLLNDGSCGKGIQLILSSEYLDDDKLEYFFKNVKTGVSLNATGTVVTSPAKGQDIEIRVTDYKIYGLIQAGYPISKTKIKLDTLRNHCHLRTRTGIFGCIFRIRNTLTKAIHEFYQSHDFLHLDPNVITINECEGGAGVFQVSEFCPKTTRDIPNKSGKILWQKDHFKRPAYLTVSSQLQLEALACSLGNVYTTNKSFRSEHSSTSKHVSEFTHLEIEMNAILEKHDADTSQMEMHLALEKEKHKRMLENRLERRRRQRIIDNEKKLEQVQVATPVDLETDLQFAQQELEQAQNIADSIMLNFMASQKAMAEVS